MPWRRWKNLFWRQVTPIKLSLLGCQALCNFILLQLLSNTQPFNEPYWFWGKPICHSSTPGSIIMTSAADQHPSSSQLYQAGKNSPFCQVIGSGRAIRFSSFTPGKRVSSLPWQPVLSQLLDGFIEGQGHLATLPRTRKTRRSKIRNGVGSLFWHATQLPSWVPFRSTSEGGHGKET